MLAGAVSVSAGGAHSCAVLSDGFVKCWGTSLDARLANGGAFTNAPENVVQNDVLFASRFELKP